MAKGRESFEKRRLQKVRQERKVEKRDRPRNPQEFAEVEFRRGAGLLNEGRIGDAEQAFSVALNSDRNHESARQPRAP